MSHSDIRVAPLDTSIGAGLGTVSAVRGAGRDGFERPVRPVRKCGDCESGFTLLELIVALALMGLAMAVVAPSFVLRPPSSDESVQRVVSSARRVAMRRAQTVTLDIDGGGSWRVTADGRDVPEVLLNGELDQSLPGGVHLRITPLGLCLTEQRSADDGRRMTVSGASARGSVFDPLTCSLRSRASAQ
ncbi:MAG: type II secretion system protein [Gemmatimonadaceae bacterium]